MQYATKVIVGCPGAESNSGHPVGYSHASDVVPSHRLDMGLFHPDRKEGGELVPNERSTQI